MAIKAFSPRALTGAAVGASLLFLGLGASAASDGDMDHMDHMAGMGHSAPSEKFAFGEPGNPAKVTRTVKIAMKDITFEPASLQVAQGETIRFVVTNASEVDHDFTIGDIKAQKAHRKEMAEMMQMGGDMHHGDDPNAISVKAGQTGELIWKFSRAGKLEFDCNIPGHFEAGMTGGIDVTGKNATSPDMKASMPNMH